MIINQNILAILRTFSNVQRKIYEKLYAKMTTSKAATTKFRKIPNRKKISIEQFNLCETKISLDEIIRFMNSQINDRSSGNDALTAEFYKLFSNELICSNFSNEL